METTTAAEIRRAAVPWEENLYFKELTRSEDFHSSPIGVHSIRMSARSLELCTENLGSESGSDIAADGISVFCSVSEQKESSKGENDDQVKLRKMIEPRNKKVATNRFPPPLTTMSGSSSLRVRRHREGCRLIIEIVETPFRSTNFQAERSEGRLRLSYLTNSDHQSPETLEAEDSEHRRNEFAPGDDEFDGEMNVDRFQMVTRCKERRLENEGLCSTWKPAFWPVATS